MGKPMRGESEKLKYQTPHHIHGAPNWGWSRIHTMEMREISTVNIKRDSAESIQWN
jgi:hypothetical protein